MNEHRIIKKYPNRRLYDTTISCYVTLEDIKKLVLNHVKFKIIDDKTKEDVTNHVLLQIINDEENNCTPIFTTEILQQMIRFYGNPYQKMMSEFLEKSFSSFTKNQNYFQTDFFDSLQNLFQQNIKTWQSVYSQSFDNQTNSQSKRKK